MFTMGDVALCSERNEDLLYKLFGKNAELLIDHAWGWEPTTIEAIKAYRPSSNSLSSGQVLHCPYEPQKAKLVVREMTDLLVLDLVDKGLVTDQMVLTVGYDIENLTDPARRAKYHGAVETDPYGREIPKQAHGSINLSISLHLLVFFAILSNNLKTSADGRKAAVECRSFVLCEGMADRIQDSANFLGNSFADFPTFFRQTQRASVPFGPLGIPDDESIGFKIVQCTGNGRLVLLAVLAQLCRSHAVQRIYVVQAGYMDASQMIGGHLLIFYPSDITADSVNQNGKCLKSFLHGCLLSLRMLKFQQTDSITRMLKCQHFSLPVLVHCHVITPAVAAGCHGQADEEGTPGA